MGGVDSEVAVGVVVVVVVVVVGCGQADAVGVDAGFGDVVVVAVVDDGVLSNCLIIRMAMALGQRTSFYA